MVGYRTTILLLSEFYAINTAGCLPSHEPSSLGEALLYLFAGWFVSFFLCSRFIIYSIFSRDSSRSIFAR